ncbi:MAG: hypothetical protein GY852_03695 [bacterium]|nr:hypothetical protein [bacterium]
MGEANEINFSFQEVVVALIRQENLHEGLWGLRVEFGLGASNIAQAPGEDFKPAAIIPIVNVGLQRAEKPTNLTADASVVNPPPKKKAAKKTAPKKKAAKKKAK